MAEREPPFEPCGEAHPPEVVIATRGRLELLSRLEPGATPPRCALPKGHDGPHDWFRRARELAGVKGNVT